MQLKLERIEDKVEFFEATDIKTLEKKLTSKLRITKHCCWKSILSNIKWLLTRALASPCIVLWFILKQKSKR
ncbi:hypothetical protein J2S00_000142 [Caldalkalibacillus uzonensis]|uniref:Uncharacterized protein n=1 Tax=Caldalkalibacillus uzonensis TaxID=353224 RepID=A0ABU0CLS9_9BACI|nr:hypothetical protein [Caldalkalibacillus uzonensis]